MSTQLFSSAKPWSVPTKGLFKNVLSLLPTPSQTALCTLEPQWFIQLSSQHQSRKRGKLTSESIKETLIFMKWWNAAKLGKGWNMYISKESKKNISCQVDQPYCLGNGEEIISHWKPVTLYSYEYRNALLPPFFFFASLSVPPSYLKAPKYMST